MRIDVDETGPAEGVTADRVQTQLRWAFGSYASEIRSVRVVFRGTRAGVECAVRVLLRGRRRIVVEALGRDREDALRFAAGRAGAAVARRVDTERLLDR